MFILSRVAAVGEFLSASLGQQLIVAGFSPTADFESLTADGTCTACSVTQDHSAYWTPPLYFQYSNGTTVMVPQVGGMLAYVSPWCLLSNLN